MAQFTYQTNSPISPADSQTAHGTLDVYGLYGNVVSTQIGLLGLHHSYPADFDMLLLGPDGKHNLAFMTDAGSSDDINYLDISFADDGIPFILQFNDGGIYKPLDLGTVEAGSNWGLPNLTVDHGDSFAKAFGGINGNGKWSLYIRDDAALATGSVDGWNLKITTGVSAAKLDGTSGADTITVLTTDIGQGEGVFQINQRGAVGYEGVTSFYINGLGGDDLITGDKEIDYVRGGGGKDNISAGANFDWIYIGANEDVAGETYDGGADVDMLQIDTYQTVDLRDDTVKNIESFSMSLGGRLKVNVATLNGVQSIYGAADLNHPDILEVTMGANTYVDMGFKNIQGFLNSGDKVVILGDADAEVMFGSNVNDVIKSGGGKDLIFTNGGMDTVDGGKGSDTVSYLTRTLAINVKLDGSHKVGVKVDGLIEDTIKNVENITGGSGADVLRGDGLANSFKGYLGDDKLKGYSGNDSLEGGYGVDKLWGGAGNDKFVFATPVDAADHIKDFSHADDTIVLDNLYFAAFAKTGGIGSKKFHANASGHDAHTAKQKLIYDKADHSLWYDADGNGAGAAVEVAIFDNKIKNLDYHDFLIV